MRGTPYATTLRSATSASAGPALPGRTLGGHERGARGDSGIPDVGGGPIRDEAAPRRPGALPIGIDAGAALPLQSLVHRMWKNPISLLDPQAASLGRGLRGRLRRMRCADGEHRRGGAPAAPGD